MYIKPAQKLDPQTQTVSVRLWRKLITIAKLKEELAAGQHLLEDMHAEHGRQEVSNFILSALDNKKINEKLDEVFTNLKCAAKVNLALGFILQNVETNDYRYYYPHENNLLLDQASLLSNRSDSKQ